MFTNNNLRHNSLSILSNSNSNKSNNNQNASLTLPITCHICLGKVKEPSVCPNLHVFCSFCIDIWLEKTKQCPTCRIQINKENPCRRILGGVENFDEVDVLKPSDFSHSGMRKARYLNLFQQYEEEINRLEKYIDSLNEDITKLKESKNATNLPNVSSPQHDMLQLLKDKLQSVQNTLDQALKERDKLKESNKKLESENSILIQDIYRLKANLNEKNSQMSSKYTLAAMESKLDGYEKEIKQLQKALEKSDKYIAELEALKQKDNKENGIGYLNSDFLTTQNRAINNNNSNAYLKENSAGLFSSSSLSSTSTNSPIATNTINNNNLTLKFIKGDNQTFKNDLKIVKFSEKIDTIPPQQHTQQNFITSPPPSSLSTIALTSSTSASKFYGSPSKTNSNSGSINGLMSFSERLKKNSSIATDSSTSSTHETIMETNMFNNNQNSNNILLSDNSNHQNQTQQSQHQLFLFSPMKRLRLDEFSSDNKASISKDINNGNINFIAKTNLNNNNNNNERQSNSLDSKKSLFKATTATSSTSVSSSCSNSSTENHLTNNSSPLTKHLAINNVNHFKLIDDQRVKENETNEEFVDNFDNQQQNSVKSTLMNSSTSEFIDCIELLNKAEQKVQNRQLSPSNSSESSSSGSATQQQQQKQQSPAIQFSLPEKYFRANEILDYQQQKLQQNLNTNESTAPIKLTKSILSSLTSPSTSSSSSASSTSSGNSLSANVSSPASSNSSSSFNNFASNNNFINVLNSLSQQSKQQQKNFNDDYQLIYENVKQHQTLNQHQNEIAATSNGFNSNIVNNNGIRSKSVEPFNRNNLSQN